MIERRRRCSAVLAAYAACGAIALPTAALGQPVSSVSNAAMPARCVSRSPSLEVTTECAVYAKTLRLNLYATASGPEPYVDERFGGRPATSGDLNEWAADPDDLASARPRVRLYDLWRESVVWVDRDDIVLRSKLRRVERCWPISRFDIVNGDAPGGVIRLKPDGSGMVDNDGARGWVHAWYLDGVYAVRTDGPSGEWRDQAWGILDVARRTVTDRAGWIDRWQLEDATAMGPSCASGPVVGTVDGAAWSARRRRAPRVPEELLGTWEPVSKPCQPRGAVTVTQWRIDFAAAPEDGFEFVVARADGFGVRLERQSPAPAASDGIRHYTLALDQSAVGRPEMIVNSSATLDAAGNLTAPATCWYVRPEAWRSPLGPRPRSGTAKARPGR